VVQGFKMRQICLHDNGIYQAYFFVPLLTTPEKLLP
jgi:hypothetical protein